MVSRLVDPSLRAMAYKVRSMVDPHTWDIVQYMVGSLVDPPLEALLVHCMARSLVEPLVDGLEHCMVYSLEESSTADPLERHLVLPLVDTHS